MCARNGRITESAMSARTTANANRHCTWPTWAVQGILIGLLSALVHGITVEPPAFRVPPAHTLQSLGHHNHFRSAFDSPQSSADAIASYPRPRTTSTPPTPLPPQLAYYAQTGQSQASYSTPAVAPSNYYTGPSSAVRSPPVQQHAHAKHQHTANHQHHPPAQQHQHQPIYESEIATVIEAPSTRIIVHDFAPMRQSAGYTRSQRYQPAERLIIRTFESPAFGGVSVRQPPRYGFRPTNSAAYQRPPYAASNNRQSFLRAQGVVRATNPPPGPLDPPVPTTKYPFTPTYQIDQQQRKYRQQQLVDGRTAKQPPHYRNSAMHEVQAPNLKYRERPLRSQIKQLKEQQRTHFGVTNDEHPAENVGSNEVRPGDANYGVYSKGRDIFRQQENEIDGLRSKQSTFKPSPQVSGSKFTRNELGARYKPSKDTLFRPNQQAPSPTPGTDGYLKHKFAEKVIPTTASYDHSGIRPKFVSHYRPKLNHETTTSGYEALRNSVSADIDSGLSAYRSNLDTSGETNTFKSNYDPLKYHSDPFDTPYQNYISSEDDDSHSDEADASNSHYNFKHLQQQVPTFIKPIQYSTYIDRSFTQPLTGPSPATTTETSSEITGDEEHTGEEFVPYRMLASVRHTERVEHKTRPEAAEPNIREKIHEEGGHIVYSEQGYEDEQYDHGDEERAAVYKKMHESRSHRRRRSTHRQSEFPFYLSSVRVLPEISALRYSSDEGRRAQKAQSFYDTKRSRNCEDIDFDDSLVNDKHTSAKEKKRLHGLGDKLDCLRQKYFGSDPLDNPIFKERLVTDQNAFGTRRKRDIRNSTDTENIPKLTIPGSRANHLQHPSLSTSSSSALVHTLPNAHESPTVILLNSRALARVRANPSMPLADILGFPEVEQSEVFIFDIAKFVPRLFVSPTGQVGDSEPAASSIASTTTTTTALPPKVAYVATATTTSTSTKNRLNPSDASGRKRKYVRTAFKHRRPNHNYSKASK